MQNQIPKNWQKDSLETLLDILIDHRGITPKKLGEDWSINGIPALSAKNIKTGKIVNEQDIRFVSQKLYEKWMPEKLEDGDILLTSEAPLGELYFLKEKKDYVLSQRLFALRTNRKKLNSRYLYYYLQGSIGHQELLRRLSGTAAEGIRQAELRLISITFPESIEDQEKIADILSSFDDKIEVNNKITKTLEEMAQAIFKQWFIKLKYPVGKLSDIAKITMGQSPLSESYNNKRKGLPFHQGVTNFGDRFPKHEVYCTENKRVAEKGDILFSVRAPVGRLNIADTKISLGRGIATIRHKNNYQSYLYYLLKRLFKKEDSLGGGSVFPSVTKDDMECMKILVSDERVVKKFEKIAGGVDKRIESIEKENQKLAALRDLLLPKLMRGEIRV